MLFERESTRKPQLSEAGRAVLSEAPTIANAVNGLRPAGVGLTNLCGRRRGARNTNLRPRCARRGIEASAGRNRLPARVALWYVGIVARGIGAVVPGLRGAGLAAVVVAIIRIRIVSPS